MLPYVKIPAVMLVAVALASLTFGCGGKESDVDTVMINGVVTLDGDPVPNATVTFVPVDDSKGFSANGTTDDKGRYTLTTSGSGKSGKVGGGAPAGDYYVGVIKTNMPNQVTSTDDPNYGKNLPTESKPQKMEYVVPKKYNNPKKSGLKVTVESGKANDIPLELKSK